VFYVLIEKDHILVLCRVQSKDIFHILHVIPFYNNDYTYQYRNYLLMDEDELSKRGNLIKTDNIDTIMKCQYWGDVKSQLPEYFY
jgi:hypothetical protein